MSVNSAIDRKYLQEVVALLSVVEQYLVQVQQAPTLESRLSVESEVIAALERVISLESEIELLEIGDRPETENIIQSYRSLKEISDTLQARLKGLGELFLQHYNSQQMTLMELVGRMKRIRQMRATLSLWESNEYKFVYAEKFLNFDAISSSDVSSEFCNVDTKQGVVTLPVLSAKKVMPNKVRIGKKSNGFPGNSDIEVTTNNINPSNALNEDKTNWFEYERLDAGPLSLSLVFEMPQESVINSLTIEGINIDTSKEFEVEDILFNTTGEKTFSIRELLSDRVDKSYWEVRSVQNDVDWSVTFLPVYAKTVTIKLKQYKSSLIKTITNDGRTVTRKRYSIGLKNISFIAQRYKDEGAINSKEIETPEALYACVPIVDVYPRRPSLFDIEMDVSFDGGENWSSSETLDDGIGTTVLMDGSTDSLKYRMRLIRKVDAFNSISSLLESTTNSVNTNSRLLRVSKFNSPARISIDEKPEEGKVFVIQPSVARRGDKYRSVRIGKSKMTNESYEIPFDFASSDIDPSLVKIKVNNRVYNRALNNERIGFGEWSFTNDFREIEFGNGLHEDSEISMFLETEQMLFEERSDGYYHKMEALFDPTKENIFIEYLPKTGKRVSQVLPKGKSLINLDAKAIEVDTIQFASKDGIAYTLADSKDDLTTGSNKIFVDSANGVLYLADDIDSDSIRTFFTHRTPSYVSPDNFEIVYENGRPWGVKIHRDAFAAREIEERVGDPLVPRINVRSLEYEVRERIFPFNSKAKRLSHDCIVRGSVKVSDDFVSTTLIPEEVEYIDGESEFLSLISMTSETTVETVAGGTGIVTFKLSAGALWYEPLRLLTNNTTVFANLESAITNVDTIGDYYVAPDGTVSVFVGSGNTLPGDIQLSYSYQDATASPENKFSIDYKEGVVYSYSVQNDDATIKYKVACYKASYDVAREIDEYSYDSQTNSVLVRTEGLADINSLVKVIWSKGNKTSKIKNLKGYFSPIISLLGFRFT